MRKTLQSTIILLMIILVSMPAHADNDELKALLNAKENKKIASAEKLISKGNEIIKESLVLQGEIDQLQNADGRIKTGKINKRSKKIAEKKIRAASYYKDGYKKYIGVLDNRLKVLEKSGNSDAKKIRADIKALEKKARKQYNKADNLASAEKMVELIELAQVKQNEAIDLQSKFLMSLNINPDEKETTPEIATEAIAIDTTQTSVPLTTNLEANTESVTSEVVQAPLTAPSNSAPVVVGAAAVAVPVTALASANEKPGEAIQEEIMTTPELEETVATKSPANTDVFLTIQFMADRKKATKEQIASIYNGNGEIIEKHINDWYKYSVGKYQSLEKAKATMSSENIKGYIVAYNKNQRISVKEAQSLLQGE